MKNSAYIVCCTGIPEENGTWFSSLFPFNQIRWKFFYYQSKEFLEKLLKRPVLIKIRIALESVLDAKKNQANLIFSHEAELAFWCGLFSNLLQIDIEHIAYSFNYPLVKNNLRRFLMTYGLKNISKFIVYSTIEKQLYHQYFKLPLEKIEFRFWSMNVPTFYPDYPLETGDYICSIGRYGRDYKSLIAAMENLPQIKLILVTGTQNLQHIKIPENVKVFSEIPANQAMNILKFSRFMVLPLNGTEIPSGHITLVSAMHLAKAFIITNSRGVQDYVIDQYNALTYKAFSTDALTETILKLWNDPNYCQQLGTNGYKFAQQYCLDISAKQYLENLLVEKGLL